MSLCVLHNKTHTFATVAQLVVQRICNAYVVGSCPASGSIVPPVEKLVNSSHLNCDAHNGLPDSSSGGGTKQLCG